MLYQLSEVKSAFILKGKVFFAPANYNNLFTLNLNSLSINYVCNLNFSIKNFPIDILGDEERIWCVSMGGIQISSYDMLNGEVETFVWGNYTRENAGAVLQDSIIWIIPKDVTEDIITFSIREKRFSVDDRWKKNIMEFKLTGRILTYYMKENKLFFILRDSKKVACFDFYEGKILEHGVETKNSLFCITYMGGNFYITTTKEKRIICWNEKKGIIHNYIRKDAGEKYYIRALVFGKKILLMDGENIECLENGQLNPIGMEKVGTRNKKGSLFMCALKYKDGLFLLPWNAFMLYKTNKELSVWNKYDFLLPREAIGEVDAVVNEVGDDSIEKLMVYLRKVDDNKGFRDYQKMIGKDIYNKVANMKGQR